MIKDLPDSLRKTDDEETKEEVKVGNFMLGEDTVDDRNHDAFKGIKGIEVKRLGAFLKSN